MATEINIKIPNNPMTMLSEGNNEFTIMASVIAYAVGTPVHGEVINWGILKPNSEHEYSFYRSVKGTASQGLELRYPKVKNVLSSMMTCDETYRKYLVNFGSTTGVQGTTFFASRPAPQGFRLNGNGTNWNVSGVFTNVYDLNSVSSGLTTLNLTSNTTGFNNMVPVISYTGRNNYRIERVYSGLGGSAAFGFYMVDISTNNRVTTAPTSDDNVHITNWGQGVVPVRLNQWAINGASNHINNSFLNNNNFWCIGMYELWMKAAPISDTEIRVKWQEKSGVTQYKLLRSTSYTVDANGDYVLTSPTTIYTGTDLKFKDTGLTADTMYYYQLTDQTDTEITQFNTKTL